jgi:hypothetical protein
MERPSGPVPPVRPKTGGGICWRRTSSSSVVWGTGMAGSSAPFVGAGRERDAGPRCQSATRRRTVAANHPRPSGNHLIIGLRGTLGHLNLRSTPGPGCRRQESSARVRTLRHSSTGSPGMSTGPTAIYNPTHEPRLPRSTRVQRRRPSRLTSGCATCDACARGRLPAPDRRAHHGRWPRQSQQRARPRWP